MTDDRIEWICDECNQPIADGRGYIIISVELVRVHQAASDRFRKEILEDNAVIERLGGVRLIPEWLLGGTEIPWWTIHDYCDTNPQRDMRGVCSIRVERIRTPAEALRWTSHLAGKDWVPMTDWMSAVLRRAADQIEGEPLA